MSVDVDDAVLAVLRAVQGLRVHDGHVKDSDDAEKTISAPTPYVVYFTTPGYHVSARLSGRSGRAQEFMVTAVAPTREGAVFTGDKVEAALHGKRVTVVAGGRPRRIARTEDNAFVRRDDVWTGPGGAPLFNDSRRYHLTAH